ncbi:uncharacterized protein LOC143025757 [Oratosquilla oratoria]|uniref:uncharacterized protein LOC143025757 n=1 Tax=Oratosquilla oratoria TaxID=337810 RepID=UPI003F75CA79
MRVLTFLVMAAAMAAGQAQNVALFWNLYDAVVTGSRILHDVADGVGAVSKAIKAIDTFLDASAEAEITEALADAAPKEEENLTPVEPRRQTPYREHDLLLLGARQLLQRLLQGQQTGLRRQAEDLPLQRLRPQEAGEGKTAVLQGSSQTPFFWDNGALLPTVQHSTGQAGMPKTREIPEGKMRRRNAMHHRIRPTSPALLTEESMKCSNMDAEPASPPPTFHSLASSGNLVEFEELLASKTEVDDLEAEDEQGKTPLHLAAEHGNAAIVQLLIKMGCKVDFSDSHRMTPLHYAVQRGHADVAKLLLEEGAEPSSREKSRGRTPLHIATLTNSLDILQILLQPLVDDPWSSRRILKVADKDGRTALHIAAHSGLVEAVMMLLNVGADVNATDFADNTTMHSAITSRRQKVCRQILELLLDSGGDVEAKGGEASGFLTHTAAFEGCTRCLALLKSRGASLETQDALGRTPLHIALDLRKVEAVKFLLQEGVDLDVSDRQMLRPLHVALLQNSELLVEMLLDAGAGAEVRDRDGRTLIQFSLLRKKFDGFAVLTKRGLTSLGSEGEHIIHYCADLGSQLGTEALLKLGYDINQIDGHGRTALHHAINYGHEPLSTFLLNSGANVRLADRNGATPLHYAVRWGGSDALIRLLVKKKANVGACDWLGRTALHYAASKSAIMSDMYILVDHGAKLDAKDNMGLTPLHVASCLGNESLVRILLESGAKHNIVDQDNFLPIDHAKENKHKSIIKRLEVRAMSLDEEVTGLPNDYGKEQVPSRHRHSIA